MNVFDVSYWCYGENMLLGILLEFGDFIGSLLGFINLVGLVLEGLSCVLAWEIINIINLVRVKFRYLGIHLSVCSFGTFVRLMQLICLP